MAESRNAASSTTDLRKKNTILDEDIGDEFMNSWKSILVAEDDPADFSFGTVTKNKKKAFDFGTLDDDFNLEGSFEKLSAFKMDIPDLDFSSLPEKAAKSRSSSKQEPPNENCQKQIDSLKFSFDFKELDGFDVNSSLESGEMTCGQKEDTKSASSSGVEGDDPKIHRAEENAVFDNSIAKKHPSSGNEMNSEVETFGRDHGKLELEVADGTSHETRKAEHTTNEEDQFEKRCLSEKHVSKSSGLAIHDIPAQFIGMNDAPKCFSSELQPKIHTMAAEISEVSGASENVTNEMGSDGTCENLATNNSSPIKLCTPENNHTEMDKSGCSLPIEADNIQLAEGNLELKDSSDSDVSRKLLFSTQESKENHLELPTVLLCREPLVNKVTVKEKEMDRNFLKSRTDVSKPQLHQSSSIKAKFLSLGNHKMDVLNRSPSIGERNLCRDSLPQNKVANIVPPVALESEKSFRELSPLSAKVNPSSSCVKTTTQTRCHSELSKLSMVSSRSSKIISAQESKLCYTKASTKFPNLSSLKIPKDLGGKQVISSAEREKERKLGNSEPNKEAGQSKALDSSCSAENAEKQKLSVINLKRRALEVSNADSMLLKPLKRLSVSPSGFRNCREPSEKKIEEQVEGTTTNAYHDQLASIIENPHIPNTAELEISLDLENNRNVEKAEACMKELEDKKEPGAFISLLKSQLDLESLKTCILISDSLQICNLLRKKHDEAKEILVRAIVHNSNLLMLNHPIYEEKNRKVQKFAATLLSKELHTKAA